MKFQTVHLWRIEKPRDIQCHHGKTPIESCVTPLWLLSFQEQALKQSRKTIKTITVRQIRQLTEAALIPD
jgi:hypothetical protein